jgi:hypothetical protein
MLVVAKRFLFDRKWQEYQQRMKNISQNHQQQLENPIQLLFEFLLMLYIQRYQANE